MCGYVFEEAQIEGCWGRGGEGVIRPLLVALLVVSIVVFAGVVGRRRIACSAQRVLEGDGDGGEYDMFVGQWWMFVRCV